MNLSKIKEITDLIGKALTQRFDNTNADEVSGKIMEFSALLGTSTEAVAMAEMVYSQKLMEETENLSESKLSATDKKYIITGRAKNEAYYVTLTERQNRALTHSLDAFRSLLSFIKADMINAGSAN